MGGAHRPVRGRLDRRDGDPVQVAPLHLRARTRPGASSCGASIRRKNEWTHLTPLPASTGGSSSIFRVSRAATLVGLDLPPASKNIELKPYGISKLTTDRARTPPSSNDLDGDVGLDAKYGVTANLTADITVNTDFAQVEVDEQQVNLTRFNLSFPEKRDFFLEGRGIFDFGRAADGSRRRQCQHISVTPPLFYSRRIGLNAQPRDPDQRRRPRHREGRQVQRRRR